jgi:glycosyltransferase involved in cell wall biosynthesis
MRIILYNPNSRGGNFDYVRELSKAYKNFPGVKEVRLLMPRNAEIPDDEGVKILMSDQPFFSLRLYSQLYFLTRSFVNPICLFFYLLRRGPAFVIFNDYDQVTSYFWVPLFKLLRKRFTFSVILHDPDRDHYFRYRRLSSLTMRKVMTLANIAFYHDYLPDRPYYSGVSCRFVSVPHGQYKQLSLTNADGVLKEKLMKFKGNSLLLGAIGNIRSEKNYDLLIDAIGTTKGIRLLISGIPANTSVSVEQLRKKIQSMNLIDDVMIIEKYADWSELKAMGEICDAFILYYSKTFQSQSGALNLFSSFRKPFLVSSNGSPMSMLVNKYELGLSTIPDSGMELKRMLEKFRAGDHASAKWEEYFSYASWDKHIEIAITALKEINNRDNSLSLASDRLMSLDINSKS